MEEAFEQGSVIPVIPSWSEENYLGRDFFNTFSPLLNLFRFFLHFFDFFGQLRNVFTYGSVNFVPLFKGAREVNRIGDNSLVWGAFLKNAYINEKGVDQRGMAHPVLSFGS